MYSRAKVDQFKALHINNDFPDKVSTYFVQTGHFESFLPSATQITEEHWRNLMSQVTMHISDSPDLFMTDAAVGDNREVETKFRVISTDANASLYLKNLLVRSPGDVKTFHHDVVVYHAPNFFLEYPASVGMTSKGPFVVHMLLKGTVALANMDEVRKQAISETEKQRIAPLTAGILFVCGTNSHSVLQSGLTTIADYFHISKLQLPLHASVLSRSTGKPTLIFDPFQNFLNGKNKDIKSSGHCIWNQKGLVRSFGSITHGDLTAPRQRGTLVSVVGATQQIVVPAGNSRVSGHPGAILFLVNDATQALPPLGVLSPSTAKAFFNTYGGNQFSDSLKSKAEQGFEQLLKESGATAFGVNINGLSPTHRDELLGLISEGKVDGKTGVEIPTLGIKAVSTVTGYSGNLTPKKSAEKDTAAFAKKLGL